MNFKNLTDEPPAILRVRQKPGRTTMTCHACGDYFWSDRITLTCPVCRASRHNDFFWRGMCEACNAENISLRSKL